MRLGLGGQYYDEEIEHIVTINMTEFGWIHLVNSTGPVGTGPQREEFLVLLADIDRMMFRATFNVYQTKAKYTTSAPFVQSFVDINEIVACKVSK